MRASRTSRRAAFARWRELAFVAFALFAAARMAWLPVHLAAHVHERGAELSSELAPRTGPPHLHEPFGEAPCQDGQPTDHEPHPIADHFGELVIARKFHAPVYVALPCAALELTVVAADCGAASESEFESIPTAMPPRNDRARAPPPS